MPRSVTSTTCFKRLPNFLRKFRPHRGLEISEMPLCQCVGIAGLLGVRRGSMVRYLVWLGLGRQREQLKATPPGSPVYYLLYGTWNTQ